ncbi:MAG: glycoside hydrolase, partial [Cyclobacteriaceae bacterium]|nr:glycoside hydrolase [Cyclobacteriaceae bacterium]
MKSLKNHQIVIILFILFSFFTISSFAKEYNVLDFGAKGDRKNIETLAIQKAIDACSKSGGIVVFPSGKYVSGTIYLKSNVTLHLQKGATILGSTDLKDYPKNLPEYSFFRKGVIKRALIYAEKLENIAIEGEGTIDGQGYDFKEPKNKNVSSYSVRPYVIWMIQCKKVRVEGVKFQNSALWMQHYLACENVYIHNIEVYNHSNKNNDMMDINGCKDVIISDCRGDTDDDGITLKSTHAQPNENITITNCILSSHCNAIKCGTESS